MQIFVIETADKVILGFKTASALPFCHLHVEMMITQLHGHLAEANFFYRACLVIWPSQHWGKESAYMFSDMAQSTLRERVCSVELFWSYRQFNGWFVAETQPQLTLTCKMLPQLMRPALFWCIFVWLHGHCVIFALCRFWRCWVRQL